jgi:outer membrane biosynthesis protein TonB
MRLHTLILAMTMMTVTISFAFAQQASKPSAAGLKRGNDPKLQKQIWGIMKSKEFQINRCKGRYLTANEGQRGTVRVSFEITPKGKTKKESVTSDLRRNAYLHSCVLSVLRSWHFPAHASTHIDMRFSIAIRKGQVFKFQSLKPQGSKKSAASDAQRP